MKSTGVIRRIDDLGRVVIPKEIRKNLRIRDGESVEIFLESDNIVLKKYSPFSDLENFYRAYVDAVHPSIHGNIMIVDRDKFVAVSGNLKRSYLNGIISSTLDEIIQNREVVTCYDFEEINLVGEKLEIASYVIAPIVARGDVLGAVIILSKDRRVDDFASKTATIAAKFLGKYIEE